MRRGEIGMGDGWERLVGIGGGGGRGRGGDGDGGGDGVSVAIVSVNWSRMFIRGCLREAARMVRERASMSCVEDMTVGDVKVHRMSVDSAVLSRAVESIGILANEICGNPPSCNGEEQDDDDGDGGIYTATDKAQRVRALMARESRRISGRDQHAGSPFQSHDTPPLSLHNGPGLNDNDYSNGNGNAFSPNNLLTIYVGDSTTDLGAWLAADIGIVIKRAASLEGGTDATADDTKGDSNTMNDAKGDNTVDDATGAMLNRIGVRVEALRVERVVEMVRRGILVDRKDEMNGVNGEERGNSEKRMESEEKMGSEERRNSEKRRYSEERRYSEKRMDSEEKMTTDRNGDSKTCVLYSTDSLVRVAELCSRLREL